MGDRLKGALRLALLAGFAVALLWLSLGSLKVAEGETKMGFILKVWQAADKPFLALSAVVTLLSHVFRSERWRLLTEPLGYPLKSGHSFISVMIGYFVNLGIPRGGEFSRCYNLYKLNGTPIVQSFGTVVAERLIDLIFLLSLIGISFLIELDNLVYFFGKVDLNGERSFNFMPLILIGATLLCGGLAGWWLFRKFFRQKYLRLAVKFRIMIEGLKKGFFIVFKVRNKVLFVAYSLGIWVAYFLMSYFIILAFEETRHLGMLESLTIFVIGGIAMALPLPGGTGSYHVLVPLGLVMLYQVKQEEAIAFSFIFHGWQTLIIILLGVLSLLASQWYIRKKRHEDLRKNR